MYKPYKKIITSTSTLSLLGALATIPGLVHAADDNVDLGELTVTGTREETPKAEVSESIDLIPASEIQAVSPAHPSELLGRVPGVHINVTGGEGHMTAIRQPLTTSPVYLYLEDGIPTRPTGFFNHNALYEVNVPQAGSIEVTKGPGTALYGSDALGGVINVLTKPTPSSPETEINLEAGEFGWKRLLMSSGTGWDNGGFRGDLNLTQTDGWRDATDYERQAATVRLDSFLDDNTTLKTVLAGSNINQQTAGSSRLSEEDYENDPTKNYTPISYRDVRAVRLSSAYEKASEDSLFSVTPYLRSNFMEYMPNWSFGYDPSIKETKSKSLGLLLKYRKDFDANRTRLIVGADIDHSPGSRLEHNIDAYKTDDIYTSFILGEKVYDYDVTYQAIAPYVHFETSPFENLRLNAGLRYDAMSYDYEDNMGDADTRYFVDFNGSTRPVTYNRPEDTKVDFSHLSPKLGATYQFSQDFNGFASYRHSFRAPSEGQLFRPGSSGDSLDLEPIKVDSYEIGVRGNIGQRIAYEVSAYHMTKTDDLVSSEDITGERITVNAGETLHRGIEIGVNAGLTDDLKLGVAFSRSKHTYEEWIDRGIDYSGNEMESAPQTTANINLDYSPSLLNGGKLGLEWVHLGEYWMDADNTEKYSGHDLYNLRINYPFNDNIEVYGRLMNITDERYATAASVSRGANEYAPGMPRTAYAGIKVNF